MPDPRPQALELAALLADEVDAVPADAIPRLLAQLGGVIVKLGARAPCPTATADAVPSEPTSEQAPLTQEQAAEVYRMPLRTLRGLTRTGRVPSYTLGRNRMIRPADLDRYLARCRDQGVKVGTRLDTPPIHDE